MDRGEELQRHHNDGQKDASEGKYEAPHGIIEDLFTWTDKGMAHDREDNAAYRSGHDNAANQPKK